jgi:hypothetical protein
MFRMSRKLDHVTKRGQVLDSDRCVGGLDAPAPLGVGGRGVGDGGQLAQCVRAAQLVCGVDVSVIGRPGVVHRDSDEPDSAPLSSMPSQPRLRWQVTKVYLSVRAQCTQCRAPCTRSPVSSNPATGAAVICSRTAALNSPRLSAARRVIADTVPCDTVPNSSESAWAVRCPDRNCPTYKYKMMAVTRGPYCPVAFTLFGRVTATDRPTAAAPLHQLVLGHLDSHRRQIEHLPALHPHLPGAGQIGAASSAGSRLVTHRLVWVLDQRQG